MSGSRRPSITIYDYPQHLNPFNEDLANPPATQTREGKSKESKHKFWTFGRSRKKRSNSFSIKSTWNGLFGKRKEVPEVQEKRSTITTVSSTYKTEPYIRPMAPPQPSKDQQEFDEALGTLARRRKYTLDNSSRYSSSLTVNGDPARIYDGSPQETTTSIMGELTPKPPARRFGQVSPKPTDKIPPLDYEGQEPKENGTVTLREKDKEQTPVPPLRRFGNRSSQRLNASSTLETEDEANQSGDVTLRDENENVPDDYVFRRFTHDAVRRSNLSINSCISIGSTASGYTRKKRRAPQPPGRKEKLETPEENIVQTTTQATELPKIELRITEPIDIARVTENIDEMTVKSTELNEQTAEVRDAAVEVNEDKSNDLCKTNDQEEVENAVSKDARERITDNDETDQERTKIDKEVVEESAADKTNDKTEDITEDIQANNNSEQIHDAVSKETTDTEGKGVEEVQIEYQRTSQENLEIIKDVDILNSTSDSEVCLRRKDSSNNLSRSDSFSVKEEIEKIERQIKELETRNASRESSQENEDDLKINGRHSIQANRRHFFQDMVETESENGIKIEFKELPREQNDIHVVRLTDSPVPVAAPREPVKVIELHISEPIKQKPEILDDVNPIPKPRRHSALNLNASSNSTSPREEREGSDPTDKRGKSF